MEVNFERQTTDVTFYKGSKHL